ncbi:hypothetical protein NO559_08480 [Dasania sp. GY-MA-18]|uniref:Uncharacterized protein n=1 Tax=Dasania phycosphaerae TaxID=2950436 RepID=A0A9J6RLH0_9GAMM|nr:MULTISPECIES: hypothetical protein [Dasania]MCR8922804.1 hypothetical protein [Dasania sp. GY-MA-18]MCZ0865234.1 hypothetical protein [Dasania phycosphaerae]MCZ0868960.1 hypothetical protein [Dasania phycosphaerae]
MKYFNLDKYKNTIRENGRPHPREVAGSLMIYALYPLAYRTGSLDIIGAMSIVLIGFLLAFKSQRDLYLHTKSVYLSLLALTLFSSALYYMSYRASGNEFLFLQPMRMPATDWAALLCSLASICLLIYSVYSSKCEINNETP